MPHDNKTMIMMMMMMMMLMLLMIDDDADDNCDDEGGDDAEEEGECAHRDVRHGAQVIKLVGPNGADDVEEVGGVRQVSVVKEELHTALQRLQNDDPIIDNNNNNNNNNRSHTAQYYYATSFHLVAVPV